MPTRTELDVGFLRFDRESGPGWNSQWTVVWNNYARESILSVLIKTANKWRKGTVHWFYIEVHGTVSRNTVYFKSL